MYSEVLLLRALRNKATLTTPLFRPLVSGPKWRLPLLSGLYVSLPSDFYFQHFGNGFGTSPIGIFLSHKNMHIKKNLIADK